MGAEPDDEMERLSAAFRNAAERSTSHGKHKFVQLSEAFEALRALIGTDRFADQVRAREDFTIAMDALQTFSRMDPDTEVEMIALFTELARIEQYDPPPRAQQPRGLPAPETQKDDPPAYGGKRKSKPFKF